MRTCDQRILAWLSIFRLFLDSTSPQFVLLYSPPFKGNWNDSVFLGCKYLAFQGLERLSFPGGWKDSAFRGVGKTQLSGGGTTNFPGVGKTQPSGGGEM